MATQHGALIISEFLGFPVDKDKIKLNDEDETVLFAPYIQWPLEHYRF